MSEPLYAVPAPEPDGYWEPSPPRCSECNAIIDAHPASRKDGRWEGWCPNHGQVVARRLTQNSEYEEVEDEPE